MSTQVDQFQSDVHISVVNDKYTDKLIENKNVEKDNSESDKKSKNNIIIHNNYLRLFIEPLNSIKPLILNKDK